LGKLKYCLLGSSSRAHMRHTEAPPVVNVSTSHLPYGDLEHLGEAPGLAAGGLQPRLRIPHTQIFKKLTFIYTW
jgi:hypothetical protein